LRRSWRRIRRALRRFWFGGALPLPPPVGSMPSGKIRTPKRSIRPAPGSNGSSTSITAKPTDVVPRSNPKICFIGKPSKNMLKSSTV
jgi:hypothetical protein